MDIGIDSFAAILPDPTTGALPSATEVTSPADDTRFGSSNTAEVARCVWQSCIYEMPFVLVELGP